MAEEEIVWEEPPKRGSHNPHVLKFREQLEKNPGKTARVLEVEGENAEKEASATAQAFNRLAGFKAEYRKVPGLADDRIVYRVWAKYETPASGGGATPPAPIPPGETEPVVSGAGKPPKGEGG